MHAITFNTEKLMLTFGIIMLNGKKNFLKLFQSIMYLNEAVNLFTYTILREIRKIFQREFLNKLILGLLKQYQCNI